jgi:hypothetical protein
MSIKPKSRREFLKQSAKLAAASSFVFVPRDGLLAGLSESEGFSKPSLPDLMEEVKRTQSEFTVYVPKSADGSTADTGNEHFLVFEGPDGSLMAVWTQSTCEGHGDHRIMFSKSYDKGRTWDEPLFLVGVKAGQGKPISVATGQWERPDYDTAPNMISMASWGYPVISKSGRIYVIYNQYQGVIDYSAQCTGTMDALYSDDNGATWSSPQTIPMERSIWDHPDPSYPPNWIVWQMPHRDLKGRWFSGLTRWVSRDPNPYETVCSFMRYENIDDDPEPKNIKISWFASDHTAIKVPRPVSPIHSVSQEPSIVRLPDNRLFCTMRTSTNYIWYILSDDDGETWSTPKPLLYHDHGRPIMSPLFCTPIYQLPDGRYILIHHPAYMIPDLARKYNIPVGEGGHKANTHRRPAFLALGEYRPDADQPIWFSPSKFFMDNDGVPLGPRGRLDLGGYTSLTSVDGEIVLWHPDRKFFLLGKKITDSFLADMRVPKTASDMVIGRMA